MAVTSESSLRLVILVAFSLPLQVFATESPSSHPATSLADRWELLGQVLTEPGWYLWGASPMEDDQGRVHLFVARWPVSVGWELGWRKHSQIARYVADRPEGPFRFVEVVLQGDGAGWDAVGMHNPCIARARGRYVLFHIANSWEGGRSRHGPNQRIGLRVSKSLDGPWQKVSNDGLALAPAGWCEGSGCGVNNPAFIEAPDGRLLLYFKARPEAAGHVRMGLAIAEKLAGPWIIQDQPITSNNRGIEDGTAFLWNDRICLLTTDNHGIIERGGGLLWSSEDGTHFDPKPQHGFHPLRVYLEGKIPAEAKFHYGRETKFERPQILMRSGRPAYLYAPSGTALHGEDGTSVHLLHYVEPRPR
jgi:hypothetical protein